MEPGESDAFDLDLAAASLRADGKDVGMMLELLSQTLKEAVGRRLVVERSKGLLKRSAEIRALEVTLGDDQLRVEVDGPTVRCTIGHSSGGIKIRSTQVDMDEWVRRLLQGLKAEANHSEAARLALEHIVLGGAS
ncbi:MAG TPA: hypothetical protein VEI83_01970 [Acidimicrobiales bacterium]|nr:hypothetical protein [Acidimicrobiales bacterium]